MKNDKKQKSLRDIGNVFEEARKTYRETVEVPRLYIDALFVSQFFEYTLSSLLKTYIYYVKAHLATNKISYEVIVDEGWTYKELIKRLQNFIPIDSNIKFYELLKDANDKRNTFIHNAFKKKTESGYKLPLDKNYHLSIEAQNSAIELIRIGYKATGEIIERTDELIKQQVFLRGRVNNKV